MELYRRQRGVQTRWASFENPLAEKGRGATANKGAKGYAFDSVAAGETKTLLDVEGSGTVCRIWMTINDRSPQMLRALRLDRQWAFYRYHLHDPVYFDRDCRTALQTIAGCPREKAIELQKQEAPFVPVSIDSGGAGKFTGLLDPPYPSDLADPSSPEGWCKFYRQGDWSATAYFYVDRPEAGLPALAFVDSRTAGLLEEMDTGKRADA